MSKEINHQDEPFCPLLTGAEGGVVFTGVTVLASGSTLLFAALGRWRGAMEVSVGPTSSVILVGRSHKLLLLGLQCVPYRCYLFIYSFFFHLKKTNYSSKAH